MVASGRALRFGSWTTACRHSCAPSNDGLPRRRDDVRRRGAGGAGRPAPAGREPRRRGERRRPARSPAPTATCRCGSTARTATASPRPAVVFAHGGGFVLCDLDSHDSFCRAMSRHTETVVVSVDYRLAPEHRAPAAAEDVFAAWCWVIDHADELGIDPSRVLIAGDSAGGNLAAVTTLMCRERGARDARRAGADLSGHRAVLRHRELSQILDRIRQHPRRDAVLLAAVSRRHDAVTRVSGGACAGRIARGPAARGRRDGGVRRAAERGRVVREAAPRRECACGASRLPGAVPRLRDDHAVLCGCCGSGTAVGGHAAAARRST